MHLQVGTVYDIPKFQECFGNMHYFNQINAAFLRRTYKFILHILSVRFFHVSHNCSLYNGCFQVREENFSFDKYFAPVWKLLIDWIYWKLFKAEQYSKKAI